MSFNFRNTLVRNGSLEIGDTSHSAISVIDALSGVLTNERKKRIEEVLLGRTWNVSVVLESIYDTGNIAAVMRSAESFGFIPFHVIERPDATYKKSDRISRGSEKWLHIEKHRCPKACVKKLKESGYKVYAATLDNAKDIGEFDFTTPSALVFGNERDGVSEELLEEVDGRFFVPMKGFTQSFNISVAAALSFYHVFRDRKQGDLTNAELNCLKAQYYMRTIGRDETIEALLASKRPRPFQDPQPSL